MPRNVCAYLTYGNHNISFCVLLKLSLREFSTPLYSPETIGFRTGFKIIVSIGKWEMKHYDETKADKYSDKKHEFDFCHLCVLGLDGTDEKAKNMLSVGVGHFPLCSHKLEPC